MAEVNRGFRILAFRSFQRCAEWQYQSLDQTQIPNHDRVTVPAGYDQLIDGQFQVAEAKGLLGVDTVRFPHREPAAIVTLPVLPPGSRGRDCLLLL